MKFVVADWETYFDSKLYTLSKMTTESYIRDPRFEAHGCAVKWAPDKPTVWYSRHQIAQVLASVDWSDVCMIHHHAQFDSLIESHHYNIRPKMIGCTLSMARLMIGNHLSVSLEAVRKHYGMLGKTTPYNLFDGRHWDEMSSAVQAQIGAGACDEVESIWVIFQRLMADGFPIEELEVVDQTVKMFTEPVLRADVDLLAKIWEDEATKKAQCMAALNVTEADLQSSERFAQLLRDEGEEPETKDGKNGPIYAFAKTDPYMRDYLLEHENDRVRTLAEARLGAKSTLMQTRAETLGWMASRGPLCVYLNYAGAGTLRPTGGGGSNFLNLKRRSPLRTAIVAPEGYLLAPADSSQIECRVLHYLAGGPDEPVIQKFRDGEDPYVDLSSKFYGEVIYKPKQGDPRYEEMESKRGMGKQGRLMCLGANTAILTNNGFKPIVKVLNSDLLWDGCQWVAHQGLIYQGEQNVVNLAGVQMTSDHQILCGSYGWQPAAECLRDENILCRGLENASENFPLRGMNWDRAVESPTSLCDVRVKRQNMRRILPIFTLEKVNAAAHALLNKLDFGLKNITAMLIFVQIKNIALAYLGAFPSYTLAPVPTVKTNGTAGAELKFINLGVEKTDGENFSRIWLRFRVGMIRTFGLIASTIMAATNRAICDLQLVVSNNATNVQCDNSKKKLPTFDISCSGPKNRFTIVSDAGPLIVHNCGYGAAGKQFKTTAKNGLYGPPVEISLEDATAFVQLYRNTNPSICASQTGYWAQAGRMLSRLAGGDPIQWGPLYVKDHRIYLPNGCPLIYDTIEYHLPTDVEKETLKEHEHKGYWRVQTRQGWKKMWGSKLTQNICEAVSRVIISQAMIRLSSLGYRALNWPYDELLFYIPDDGRADYHMDIIKTEMKREVPWLPGLPLDCEINLGQRYSK